jgi:hypothetical protein
MALESPQTVAVEIESLFGPPPVLSTEKIEAYNKLIEKFLESFTPADVFGMSIVRYITDFTWESIRYTRHKTLAIDRKFRERLAFQAKRKRLLAERKEQLAMRAKVPTTEGERIAELQDITQETISDVDEILERTPKELDHVQALEAGIEYQERLDKLQDNSLRRVKDALEQWDQHEAVRRLFKLSAKIIQDEHANGQALADNSAASVVPEPEEPR